MAYAGKGISVLNPNRNDDIVRNDKRIGQKRTLNGGRAIQQNVIVGSGLPYRALAGNRKSA